ncbi:MAG: biotin--[acetyl-CoA-carboxylase] ligase [Chlamydiae bacterium CG10_big_fil_rev_8_21_14_0_10_35_9]|nr:MAG: biotin--[acetyl-CoA-carboxylase] ligase [Chlamydiae bacterium CG10_big_fil_rev_8_21_14_0_10_35_9]
MKIKNIQLDSIDSTNNWAKAHVNEFDSSELTVISAKQQTAGRGRFQRTWVSPGGENIYATFYFTLPTDSMHIGSLAQLMTLSIAEVLIDEDLLPKIRWPNDVLLNGKKLAGVLCEMSSKNNVYDCFIGVGINVDLDKQTLDSIDKPATSLNLETDRFFTRDDLLKKLQNQFLKDLEVFKERGFVPFLSQYENLMAYIGRTIICKNDGQEWEGVCHSLSNEGQLNVCLPSGEIVTLSSAEVSLKVVD